MEMLTEILRNLVSEDILEKIKNDFEKIADTNILELGIDSLSVMEIVIRIESLCQVEINYDMFEIEQIETPRKILEFAAALLNES